VAGEKTMTEINPSLLYEKQENRVRCRASRYYHISDLAEIIYFKGISKSQRRKFSSFHPDTSVHRIWLFLIEQRSISLLVYYGGPPTAINAVLAINADGRRAIVVIYREAVQINYFPLYFIDDAKTLQRRPRPTPCEEVPGGAVFLSVKTMSLEGKTVLSWWGCFVLVFS
jgi:hypothetical protein